MNYDAILIDADDTLFDFEHAEAAALESTLSTLGFDLAADGWIDTFRRINARAWADYEAGRATSQEIRLRRFVEFLTQYDIPADPAEVSRRYVDHLAECGHLFPGALHLLDTLHGLAPLALVTNGIAAVQRSRIARAAIADRFTAIVISEEVGSQKPDRAIFEHAVAALSTSGAPDPSRIVMIGDGLHSDIKGAIDFGIDAIWFNVRNKPADPAIVPTATVRTFDDLYPLLGIPG
ncbi:MAG: noncanonical pyrimidine nucleotidase, YjjG family [Spirochaetaceae bacterium]|nr:MAG: noncanonical pyrimidine nucleotidase, YjjG family [Spirochaetaceae bacterium]